MTLSTEPPRALDKTDRRILHELQGNGRISNVALSTKVNLSPTPCLERVKRLEREGFIKAYKAILNPAYLNAALLVFVEIRLTRTSPHSFDSFREAILKIPEVLDCHLVTGNFDYLVKARVQNMMEYRNLLGDKLLPIEGVEASRTYVVMEELKESLSLSIPLD